MQIANKDIRNAIKDKGLKGWQVADALKISENTFYRRLRHELAPAEKEEMFRLIRELAAAGSPS